MIESIEFHHFKVLREATIRLGRFNLLVGPNGSGKSTVLEALEMARGAETLPPFHLVASARTTPCRRPRWQRSILVDGR
jgi:recombinational DNA repair ATPase RecF